MAAVLVVSAAGVAVWANRAVWGAMGKTGIACGCLKVAGFVLLGLCLLQPQWVSERARKGENVVVLLADNGKGLETGGRGEGLKVALGELEKWQVQLADDFRVERMVFDERVRSVEGFGELGFDGEASNLANGLATVERRFKARPVAGVLAFTDGNATDWPEDGDLPPGMAPVFPVVPDAGDEVKDLALRDVSVTMTAFEDAPVEIVARTEATGIDMEGVYVRVVDGAGEEAVRGTPGSSGVVRLRLRPVKTGVVFYTVEVGREGNDGSDEATLANNSRVVVVDRGGGPFRVLYVSGRPNWEYKFLNRALKDDDEIDLVGLIRVAKREPKFEFRGRSGESANPLFRGFGEEGAEPEYDQPVVVRLGTEDELELADGFPREAEALFRYHAVLVDDLEAGFFTAEQMELARKFVAVRGGGLLMMGGQETFGAGGYAKTALEGVLPVYLGEGRAAEESGTDFYRWQLTREGLLEPWVRLRDTEVAEVERWGEMPVFLAMSDVGRTKPGGGLLAEAEGSPALAVQRYGRGRSAALTVADVWRWGMREPEQRLDMEKGWRQLVRWLVGDVPGQVELGVKRAEGASGLVTMRVVVRGNEFEPEPEAEVRLVVERPGGGDPVTLDAVADDGGEPGVFLADFRADESGGFLVKAEAFDYEGEVLGTAEAGWAWNPEAEEFASLGVNRARMEGLAEKTGGRVLEVSELGAFVEELPEMDVPVVEVSSLDLWHVPVVFLLGVGMLGAEWGLRRARGFA